MIPKFPAVKDSLHAELRRRVNAYFETNGIEATGNAALFTKAILLMLFFGFLYVHLIFFTPNWYFAIPELIIMGGVVAAIGFNIMHDGSHGSFSRSKWLNHLAARSVNLVGANHFMWNVKHNMIHHSFTNIDGIDDDIEVGFLMRMAPTQKKYWVHRFQHIYFIVLYMLLYVFWIFFADYKKYFSGKIGNIALKKMEIRDHLGFWFIKAFHFMAFVVIPIYFIGWIDWMAGFFTMTCVTGFILSIVFQLAHTVEGTDFPEADPVSSKLPDEFALHQIKTTANFATHNKLVSWLVGGLNFQIEHHLFPKISHVHYPAISKIVRTVCKEYQLQYIEYPTVRGAVAAHVRFLRKMGRYY
ncbi:MAG: acyl-CoA desaturase [Hydrotalea flava]|uniref:fatty acid desaturase family protein n=1 Tax=Hydrotalea TaxID=1004300 RepID=UPI0016A5EF3D|nr:MULTISPECIES: acyl-CoA desaturase [Hydrotalea]MBY0347458.1 acyl-CoA desaturase [Hydrotalea flava]NIM36310.1 acyl-CoA desaturase [Hydrotalea flava]NIM39165.1 acyl-CoA desaturase [Hydrotalea flava]NIN04404.1 acyl-CoA desaturase [Hydrotalea flava]NIN16022.1 acyl-CoA desaturase [Hydrotalea flava]